MPLMLSVKPVLGYKSSVVYLHQGKWEIESDVKDSKCLAQFSQGGGLTTDTLEAKLEGPGYIFIEIVEKGTEQSLTIFAKKVG